jgi:hypothetical protein
MSDQKAEQPGGEQGSLNLGISPPADTSSEPAAASAAEVTQEASHAAAPAEMTAAADASVTEPSTSEAPKAEGGAQASQPEATKPEVSQLPGRVIVMPRGDRAWADHGIHAEPEAAEQQSVFGKRRIAAIAAMVALATAAGALGGALATATFMQGSGDVAVNSSQTSVEASLSRIDSDIQSLKTGLDHTSKLGMTQFNKTSDRLDRLERAQADPAAKIAKLSEAVDKLRVTPAAVPVAAAAVPAASSASKETTGSIAPAPAQQASVAAASPLAPKTEIGRLPTLEDWVLRDVGNGSALIDGRRGVYEVYAGDVVPGLGRVDAIRRQDGRWVVVTSRGLIVAR